MIGHEHVDHVLLKIECVCLLYFMLASFTFMKNVNTLFLLIE